MKSRELNQLLLDRFPEIENKFNEETEWQEGIDTGSTVVYEDVFMPYLLKAIEDDNQKKLKLLFNFIEELSAIEDEYVKNVIRVAIIDNFHYYDDEINFKEYLQKNSLKIFNELDI